MNKQLATLTVGLLALAATPVVAGASHSGGKGPKKDFVRGTGHFEGISPIGQTDITMHVSARSGPSGQNPKGRFYVKRELPTELRVRGTVTCVNVVGNQAVVGGRIERGQVPDAVFPIGGGILFQFDDNGNGSVISDRMHGSPTSAPTVCPAPIPAARLPVQRGNFVVHDYTP
ncbi:MAG TPA: hypothetical protein VGR11_00765 [Solirubrobacteraceae bacterium]|nr:hypothetical protein [Solirubrobacteraceae bacterium]